jgi:solute carrier family 25 phosphate transporter 23/24/25/41
MKEESQDERDLGVEKLWEILDSRRQGQIDLKDFKKGLKQIDHRTLFSFLLSGQKSGK